MPDGNSTFWSFSSCQTDELDAVNMLKEPNSAWWDNFVSEHLLKKVGDKIFALVEDCLTN